MKYGPSASLAFLYDYSYCANFVSQCLEAGGLEVCEEWHNYGDKGWLVPKLEATGSWIYTSQLQAYLESLGYQAYEINNNEDLEKAIEEGIIKIGDPIFLYNHKGENDHAMLIGDISEDNCYMYGDSKQRDALNLQDRREANLRDLLDPSKEKYSRAVVILMRN